MQIAQRLSCVGFAVCCSIASLGQCTFLANATINDGDTHCDGQDVLVHGCTLTINGQHTFRSLVIQSANISNPGFVTHSPGFTNGTVNGLYLIITTDLTVRGPEFGMSASYLSA